MFRFGLVQVQLARTLGLAFARVLMAPWGHAKELVSLLLFALVGVGVPALSACRGRMARPRFYLVFDLTTGVLSAALALL